MLAAAGILFLIYYMIIVLYVGSLRATFSRFWLLCGVALLILDTIWEQIPECIQSVAVAAAGAGMILFMVIQIQILYEGRRKPVQDLDFLIVLGAKVDKTRLTTSLRDRLEQAAIYAKENPRTKLIVTGGQGPGEEMTEAEAMYQYLREQEIEAHRIYKEESATSTEENFRFSYELIERIWQLSFYGQPGKQTVGIVTNSFHIYRAMLLGKWIDAKGRYACYPVAASSDPVLLINYVVREFFGILWLYMRQKKQKQYRADDST